NALVSSAREFNQVQPKNSFISMKMTVSDIPVTTTVIPAQAAEAMQLEIDCEQCQTRFAVIGSAYFCPGCGHNSVTRTYSDSLHKITVKLDCLDIVRKDIVKSMGKDKAELICRSILESCLSDGVVAFQKYCDGLYARYGTPPQNVFQRIDQGSDLWTKAIGKGYDNWQTPDELAELKVLYQKRHILAHNEGIVDQQYLVKSGDTIYKNGQRIVVAPRDVQALLGHLGRLGAGLKTACDKQGLAKF
ncbi:MAG: Zn finger protein HypA/HybF involved in hydrogenase expression, partial [Rhodoferax sp.]